MSEKKLSAGHCMVFAKTDRKCLQFEMRAIVLMQMRFDGKLGFAGGLIEADDISLAEGVSRELEEEMGLDPKLFSLSQEHHICSHPADDHPEVDMLHFYALQITEDQILDVEKNAFSAADYGDEVLGWIRVPLYTMDDGYRGFPAFLNNNFAGNSRQQLLLALEKTGVLSLQEIEAAKIASNAHYQQN